ncbi:MAG: hypothetical protein H7Y17_14380 [Chlorobia bacterium]|nr:hypothetical protein [Fimbriimonadaceae bacterium]
MSDSTTTATTETRQDRHNLYFTTHYWINELEGFFDPTPGPGRPRALTKELAAVILADTVATGDIMKAFTCHLSPDTFSRYKDIVCNPPKPKEEELHSNLTLFFEIAYRACQIRQVLDDEARIRALTGGPVRTVTKKTTTTTRQVFAGGELHSLRSRIEVSTETIKEIPPAKVDDY